MQGIITLQFFYIFRFNTNFHLNNKIITNFSNKNRSLAIGCRICGNEQSYEKKKKKHSNMKKYLLIKISKK